MAFDFGAFETGLENAILAALPEIRVDHGGGDLWFVDDVARLDLDHLPGTPYGVIEWGALTAWESLVASKAYNGTIQFHYIADRESGGGISRVQTQLDALRAYLLSHELAGTTGSILDVTGYDWSPGHPANAIFYAGNKPYVAGGITLSVLVGE